MALGINRGNAQIANQNVLLEVQLPDDPSTYKYSVKRLSKRQITTIQVRTGKRGGGLEEIGAEVMGVIYGNITPIDNSIDFEALIDKVADAGGDEAIDQLNEYVVRLSKDDIGKLRADGISVW